MSPATYAQYIKKGMQSLHHLVLDKKLNAHDFGIPRSIFSTLANNPSESIPVEWQQKYVEAMEYIIDNKALGVFLVGNDSVDKDVFAAAMLLFWLDHGQRVRLVVAPSLTEPITMPIFAVAFMGVDIPGLHTHFVKTYVRSNLLHGRLTILGGMSLESIEETMGQQIMSYLVPKSITIDLSTPRPKMPTF